MRRAADTLRTIWAQGAVRRVLGALLAPVLPLVLLLALLLAAPGDASAISPAAQTLQTSITRVLSILERPAYVTPAARGPLRRQIEDEVYHIFDFSEFSARAIGQSWQSFTPEQRSAFSEAFANLLFSTYLSQIDGYNGEEVRYTGERANETGTRVEVATELTLKDGRVVPMSYRMMPGGESWVVYDVLVSGVSLVRNYRSQFQEILAVSTPEELIARVRARAGEVDGNDGVER